MSTTFLTLKKQIASYGGETAAGVRYVPADYIINSVDLLAIAINNARRSIERAHDFYYSTTTATLPIGASGTSIDSAVLSPVGTIKRVQDVLVPTAGSGLLPVEFITDDTYRSRQRAQLGRQAYLSTNTLADYGVTDDAPIAIVNGQTIQLYPADQFSFPVSATLVVVRFQPDYSADGDHDFISDIAPDYLQWQGIVELNRLTKNFSVRPSEGDVTEPMDLAQSAMEALLQWDRDVRKDTSTPATAGIPVQRPKK